ncbi:PBP1A family penicillin-binding protein [Aerococcus sanguinicola]|uniref:PBP1A family penicillin-binding protein n=1 Tax=unclassified Aerococcus TaxID=2618060 RepID=UPI0008A28E8D|nr:MULTISPECIES: PBP1A family penicillin-binding protein [unclassified Aerococcus]KAB0646829.1 PBP1A family penicillin-binding protein [Aerococcus sanguinicola]MDK6234133.1 PBP1A family penicillin-binding protein [Aerococcus sp. UMB10185]MDK6855440.1 PBP1A family penicillin-binding protein [Aerococcus sp. UMB7533]MDK8501618.1 PBP1A family penicillin-binding protein [Aerococcus sp. UMB1112A]OFN00454.1 penicillin-binding protein [Aerococcus sp. HMSC062A02]
MSEKDRRHQRYNKKRQPRQALSNQSLWKKIILAIVGFFAVIALLLGLVFAYWAFSAPELTEDELRGSMASIVYDNQGQEIYETSQNERRIVKEDEISQLTFDAVTSIEDQRFMKHNGIDPKRIIGSLIANIRAGGISQGGSTLTQQLVKLSAFSTKSEDQTYKRKVQEMMLALQLERNYTKKEIFEFYINKVYMANGVYGMGTAAEVYYGTSLNNLGLPQTALLAGMVQAPNNYNPYTNPEAAKERRDLVLSEMLENGKISQADYEAAVNTPIDAGLQPLEENREKENSVNQVVDSYIQQVAEDVKAAGYDMWSDGLKIYTHLDMNTQNYITELLNDPNGAYFQDSEVQAAASIVDTKTGHIIALFGGRNQTEALSLNRATQLNRSVGSSIKPLSDYGPAIEHLNISPATGVKDEPYRYSSGDPINNWDRQHQGLITMRQALAESRNIPALKVFQAVGAEKVNDFLNNLDINLNNGEGVYESNSIGGEITPLKLSAAFAAVGNYGEYNEPKAVDYFVTLNNEKVEVSGESRQAMRESTAYILTDMMKSVFTEGLSAPYHNGGIIEAGKSGTTNYTDDQIARFSIPSGAAPDRWMSGFTTNYSISIWMGYDNPNSPNGYITESAGHAVDYLYRQMMDYVSNGAHNEDWQKPDTVHEANLVALSNPVRLATASTPYSQTTRDLINENLYEEFKNSASSPGNLDPNGSYYSHSTRRYNRAPSYESTYQSGYDDEDYEDSSGRSSRSVSDSQVDGQEGYERGQSSSYENQTPTRPSQPGERPAEASTSAPANPSGGGTGNAGTPPMSGDPATAY